jgi:hypothetical protein
MGLPELSNVLWRERELLEMLLFKLEQEQLVLAAGRTRWLARSTREVEVVLQEIRRAEVVREIELQAVAEQFGVAHAPRLRDLVEAVDEPWSGILAGHRDAFLVMTAEISALAESNRELLSAGARSTYEVLLSVGGGSDTYTAAGSQVAAGARRATVDEVL